MPVSNLFMPLAAKKGLATIEILCDQTLFQKVFEVAMLFKLLIKALFQISD